MLRLLAAPLGMEAHFERMQFTQSDALEPVRADFHRAAAGSMPRCVPPRGLSIPKKCGRFRRPHFLVLNIDSRSKDTQMVGDIPLTARDVVVNR